MVCEEQGRYQRCANWTLDIDNNKLVENNLYDEVNCSAKITGKRLFDFQIRNQPDKSSGSAISELKAFFKHSRGFQIWN